MLLCLAAQVKKARKKAADPVARPVGYSESEVVVPVLCSGEELECSSGPRNDTTFAWPPHL